MAGPGPTHEAVRVDGERVPVGAVEVEGICVVTIRSKPTPQNATRDVLAILERITAVSLITTQLSPHSPIHDRFDLTEVGSPGSAPGAVLGAVARFVGNQLRLGLAIARSDAEVVWFFGATAYLLPVLVARLLERRVVVQSRGDVPLTLRLTWGERFPAAVAAGLAAGVRGLERVTLRLADRVVTYSPEMATTAGLDPGDPRVAPLGSRFVDLDRFRPAVPYETRDRVVGFVGRLDVEKGIDTLVALTERLPDDVKMLFVGDGPERRRIERELGDRLRDGRVEVTGWINHDEVPRYMNRMQLVVMPSAPTEGLPTTIAEAFACGTPVYATPVSGIPDLVVDGATGFHMTESTPDAIAARIEAILARDDLDEVSRRCREVAEERYSLDAAVARYRAILSGL